MMDTSPPPLREPYRVLEYKRRLASSGIERGVRDFIAAYPQTPLRTFELPYRSAREHARDRAETYRVFAPAGEDFVVRALRTIGDGDARDFTGRSRAHFLACFHDATAMGGSHLLRTDGAAIADFQDDELQRFRDLPELDCGIFTVADGRVHVLESAVDTPLELDEAYVTLLSPHSGAFGHWTWHQMTRFAAALESGGLHDMPVLVDRDMPATHFEALRIVIGGRDMPLVPVDLGASVRVRHAWFGSAPFYVPYSPRMDGHTWSIVSTPPRRYLPAMRVFERSARAVSERGRGERIFLARRPTLRRRMVNAEQIEALALRYGFTIVYSEELTFAEQLAAMRDARYVAGPEGSAMFLNFYASPGTSVAILDHPYVGQITNYSAPLVENGIDVVAMTGRVVRANDEPGYPNFGYKHFADYEIDAPAFEAFLAAWCGPHRTSGARTERVSG